MVSLGTAAAAAASSAGAGLTLFDYNRKNFLYDRKMRQETEYQIMDFRIKQAELWREDVRDIIGLTSVKMDTYLIVNAVQLGFCVMAFCEGRLAAGTPQWLIGCHTLSLAGAFMYLLMSVWLSMHASVTAKSYEVRLLTQHVRLPVPSWAALEGARTYSSTFEKVESRQMFRMPFVMGTQENVLRSSVPEDAPDAPAAALPGPPTGTIPTDASHYAASQASSTQAAEAPAGDAPSADLWGLEGAGDSIYELDGSVRADPKRLKHLALVREAMQYWQSYDGFARVAMSMGTNQLVTALAYYVIGYVLISNHAVIASWLVVMLFMVIAAALIRLDMSLTGLEYRVSVVLVISGPCLLAVAAEQWSRHTQVGDEIVDIITPIAYLVHATWLMFLLYISKVSEQQGGALLPTGFRSVMYIDVFGWIRDSEFRRAQQGQTESPVRTSALRYPDAKVPGCGPAVQSVRYDEQGCPVPQRPERLPGALPLQAGDGPKRQDFEPTTFVPREKDNEKGELEISSLAQSQVRPGFVPWRIFCAATVLLICLWWFAGVFVLLSSFGIEVFNVSPLLREEGVESVSSSTGASKEQAAGGQATHREAVFLQHGGMITQGGQLTGARMLEAHWPHSRVQAHGLSCSDLPSGPALVASTRFGLYSAQIDANTSEVAFMELPCEGVEGESLGDVAMLCGEGGAASCRALALHRQGQKLSGCALAGSPEGPVSNLSMLQDMSVSTSIADMWLRKANIAEGQAQEEVAAFALAGPCREDASQCAFVETTAGRIVEIQQPTAPGGGAWFPTRTLRGSSPDDKVPQGGTLTVVGRGHLVQLRPEQGYLDFVRTDDGALVGRYRLPRGVGEGAAVCSAGGSIFLLGSGSQPELWKFPVPKGFADGPAHAAGATPGNGTASAAGPEQQEQPAKLRAGRFRGQLARGGTLSPPM